MRSKLCLPNVLTGLLGLLERVDERREGRVVGLRDLKHDAEHRQTVGLLDGSADVAVSCLVVDQVHLHGVPESR